MTKLAAGVLSLVAFAGMWWLINRTKVGKALTATALDAQAARYMGIPTEKMNALAWGLGGRYGVRGRRFAGEFLAGGS